MKAIGTVILLVLLVLGALRKSRPWFVTAGVFLGLLLSVVFVDGPQLVDDSGISAGSVIYLLCLAVGFFSITLTTWVFTEETQIWPILPGALLASAAIILFLLI